MLLNIIFGIVIDTFAQQRDLQKQIKDDIDNVCFVCGIDRNTFDRKHPIGFEHHIRFEHNLWHYCTPCVSNTRARARARAHTHTHTHTHTHRTMLFFLLLLLLSRVYAFLA